MKDKICNDCVDHIGCELAHDMYKLVSYKYRNYFTANGYNKAIYAAMRVAKYCAKYKKNNSQGSG